MTSAKRSYIRPEEAAANLAQRELARRRLVEFGQYVQKWWKPYPHHMMVAEALEQVELYIQTKGKEGIGRLIVEIPPRHGKTELASKIFPAWLLGRMPDSRVILTAYGADLAQDNSRAVRQIVTSTEFQGVFGDKSLREDPVSLSDDSRAKNNWDLAAPNRGGVVSAGVGGGITGKGAHLLVIDDPFKNREEAESESRRKEVMSWYVSSAYSRLEDGGAVVIMHTRWHREDLTGQLIRSMSNNPMADQWKVICLPALAMEEEEYAQNAEDQHLAMNEGLWKDMSDPLGRSAGAALWPEKYNESTLAKIKINQEENGQIYEWWALYQQQPRPMDGGFFTSKSFEIVEKAPEKLQWVRYCDLALSEKKSADFNASVAMAIDGDGNVYLRDMIRMHGWDHFRKQFVVSALSPEERGTIWGIEDVAFQALAFQELIKDPRLAGVSIRRIRPQGDKVERARPLLTRGIAGKLKLVRGAWNQQFITEALDFPKGRHDDQVDTASGGLVMISKGYGHQREARSYSWI